MKKIKLRESLNTKDLVFENLQLFVYPSTVEMLDDNEACVCCCDEIDKERIERELFRNGCPSCTDYNNDLKLTFDVNDLYNAKNDLCCKPEETYYYVCCDDCDGGIDNVEFDNFGDAYEYTLDSMCDDNYRLSLFDTNDNRYITAVHRPIRPIEQDDCENRPYWDVQINECLIEDEDMELSEAKRPLKYKFIIVDKRNGYPVTESDYEYDSREEARNHGLQQFSTSKPNLKQFRIEVISDKDVEYDDEFESLSEDMSATNADAVEQLGRYLRSTKEQLERLNLFDVSDIRELTDTLQHPLGGTITIKSIRGDNRINLTAHVSRRFTKGVQQYLSIGFAKTVAGLNKSQVITDILGVEDYKKDSGMWVIPYAPSFDSLVKALIVSLYPENLYDFCSEHVKSLGISMDESLAEDYTDVFHNWGKPYTIKECTEDLRDITDNFTTEGGSFVCRHDEWRNMCEQILRKYYKHVNCKEVYRKNNDKSEWVVNFSGLYNTED